METSLATSRYVVDDEFEAAVRVAGKCLASLQVSGFRVLDKAGGSSTTDADIHSQRLLVQFFHTRYPGLPILVEEERVPQAKRELEGEFPNLQLLCADDDSEPLPQTYVSIDPADGTAFFENGSPDFAVSAAIIDGGTPVAGAVYQPAHDQFFAWPTDRHPLTDISQNERELRRSLIGLDNCKATGGAFRESVVSPLINSCRYPENLGSVTSGIHLLRGITGLWVTDNARNWDVAATALLVQRAGGVASCLVRSDGKWEGAAIPWNCVRMPPLLFAANDRLLRDALDAVNARNLLRVPR